MIHELRILPPLAIARFGSAATPMDNYDVVVDPDEPLGYRRLVPADTFELDVDSGEITRVFKPDAVTFVDEGDRVRPVAPFLELWALTGDEQLTGGGVLEPLTIALLQEEGAVVADLRWHVQVSNLKVVRRTNDRDDRVIADTDEFSGHDRRPLVGRCENFVAGKTIGFGHVQAVRPTAAHPEVRLRFTPAAGLVYGSNRAAAPDAPFPDPNVADAVYDAGRGGWLGYRDFLPSGAASSPNPTAPGEIYAGRRVRDPDGRRRQVSFGYLDDGCDGLVRVTLATSDGRTLRTFGRVGSGPPTYAPDAGPIRSVADELEQALLGPAVEPAEATFERVEEIVRRGLESVRLMNTAGWNVNPNLTGSDIEIMDPSLVDVVALTNLHQSLLVALRSGAAPWFADVLREPEEAGDMRPPARRKMPALMRGADGELLALTRRQIDLVRTLARAGLFTDPEPQP